jgi:hypothetical protein
VLATRSTHQAPYRIVDPNFAPAPRCRLGAEILPNGSVPLWKRRGVASLAPDREGHEGLNGCVPWGHTGPLTGECSVQTYNEDSDAIHESASIIIKDSELSESEGKR